VAEYRQIFCAFWEDPQVMEEWSREERYFYLFLITNPYARKCAIYPLTIHKIQEIGFTEEEVKELLNKFESVYKKIRYNEVTREIAIKNWMKYNYIGSPTWLKSLEKELAMVRDRSLIAYMRDAFKAYCNGEDNPFDIKNLPKINKDGYPIDTVSIPYRWGHLEKERKKERKTTTDVVVDNSLILRYRNLHLSFSKESIRKQLETFGSETVTGALEQFELLDPKNIKTTQESYFIGILKNYIPVTENNQVEAQERLTKEILDRYNKTAEEVEKQRGDPEYHEEAAKFFELGHGKKPKNQGIPDFHPP
jgi:hypothetical protein